MSYPAPTREEWIGMVQAFMEWRMKDAPDEQCRALAEAVFEETATMPDGDEAEP